jgi:8-oxo-dGTP pyrophosphatase MutT (NUDIX family)
LDGALARRAVVARAIATDAYGPGAERKRLTALADAAERAPRSTREASENALSAALAQVEPDSMPVGLVAELADAEARVLLARRFHNDAVRDTLALRVRRPVRWLRLGGHAPMPSYFEIAEQTSRAGASAAAEVVKPDISAEPDVRLDRRAEPDVRLDRRAEPDVRLDRRAEPDVRLDRRAEPDVRLDRRAEPDVRLDRRAEPDVRLDRRAEPDVRLDRRTSARVVLLDERGCVLLFCGSDPAKIGPAPRWWFTVGGQVQPGERLAEAAVRELAEETGLEVKPDALVGPVWRRDAMIDFNGSVIASQEFFFVYRSPRFEPLPDGRTELELRYIHGHRWCDVQTIDKLVTGGETVYPVQLGELLAEANLVADGSTGGTLQLQPIR